MKKDEPQKESDLNTKVRAKRLLFSPPNKLAVHCSSKNDPKEERNTPSQNSVH
jgi:hypothetical protein